MPRRSCALLGYDDAAPGRAPAERVPLRGAQRAHLTVITDGAARDYAVQARPHELVQVRKHGREQRRRILDHARVPARAEVIRGALQPEHQVDVNRAGQRLRSAHRTLCLGPYGLAPRSHGLGGLHHPAAAYVALRALRGRYAADHDHDRQARRQRGRLGAHEGSHLITDSSNVLTSSAPPSRSASNSNASSSTSIAVASVDGSTRGPDVFTASTVITNFVMTARSPGRRG